MNTFPPAEEMCVVQEDEQTHTQRNGTSLKPCLWLGW